MPLTQPMPLTRRVFCSGMLAASLAARSEPGALFAYVDCYTTTQRSARDDSIHVYRIDPRTTT